MEKNNSNYSPDSRYLLNFSFSQKRLSSKDDGQTLNFQAFSKSCMSSNIISETSLEENHILLKKSSKPTITTKNQYYYNWDIFEKPSLNVTSIYELDEDDSVSS